MSGCWGGRYCLDMDDSFKRASSKYDSRCTVGNLLGAMGWDV